MGGHGPAIEMGDDELPEKVDAKLEAIATDRSGNQELLPHQFGDRTTVHMHHPATPHAPGAAAAKMHAH
ncbi:hypothetical protein DTL42_02420 [Bremerella cremea]|uniref:Uncharacterized protein n=1 Tax=Bremerella cremea TaxID=1031537 RepID=A0A368KUH7_9BACT|nr:hypothetical protein [Bremerella cremea]RCS54029.1 hypothetical protein DTL42_02420 [Bremerella cremea]